MNDPEPSAEPAAAPRRRGLLRRLLGALLALMIGGLVLLVGLWLSLDPERLTPLLAGALDRALPGRVFIGRAEWALPFELTLDDVALDTPEGAPALSAARLRGSLVPWAFLGGTLEVRALEARALRIDLVRREGEEAFGLIRAVSAPSAGPGAALEVDLEISEAAGFDLTIDQPGFALVIRGSTVTAGRLTSTADLFSVRAGLRARSAELTVAERRFGPTPASARAIEVSIGATTGGGAVAAEALEIELEPELPLTANGRISGLGGTLHVDASASADIRLEDARIVRPLLGSFGEWLDPRGRARATVGAHGLFDAPVIEVELSGRDLEALGQPLSLVELDLTLDGTELQLHHLEVDVAGDGGHAEVEGALGLGISAARAGLSIALRDFALARWLDRWVAPEWLPAKTGGTITLSHARWSPPSAGFALALELDGLPLDLTSPTSLRLEGRIAADRLELSSLSGVSGPITVAARGPIDLVRGRWLDVTFSAKAPAEIGRVLGIPRALGSLSASGTLRGALSEPQATGTLRGARLLIGALPAFDLVAPFQLDRRRLITTGATLTATAGAAFARGTFTFGAESEPHLEAELRTSPIQLRPLTGGALAGTARLEATLAGPLAALSGEGSLALHALTARGAALGGGTARLELDEGRLALSDLALAPASGGEITAAAALSIPSRAVEGEVTGRDVAASMVQQLLEQPLGLEGHASFALDLGGRLDAPEGDLALAAEDLSIDGEPVGALGLTARGDSRQISVAASITGEAGTLALDGRYEITAATIDGSIAGSEIVFDRLPVIRTLDPAPAGRADVDLRLSGALRAPSIRGRVDVSQLSLSQRPVFSQKVRLDIEPSAGVGMHRIRLRLAPKLDAVGVLDVRPPFDLEAFIELRELMLEDVLPELSREGVGARAWGTANLLYRRGRVSGALDLSRLELSAASGRLALTRQASLRYDADGLALDHLELDGTLGNFSAGGRYGKEVDFTARGLLDLTFLVPFLPFLAQADGLLEVSARAEGPATAPELSGEISVPGTLRLRPRGGFREVVLDRGRIALTTGALRADGLAGHLSGGKFQLSGSVALDGLRPAEWDLAFDAQAIPARSGDLSVEANANLRVRGVGLIPRVEGALEIIRGRYTKAFKLENFSFVAKDRDASEPLIRQAPWLRDLELDLRVLSSGAMDLKVDASAINVDLGLTADVRVTGTFADPILEGRVTAEQGRIAFPKAKLEVDRGVVDFAPSTERGINPHVSLDAEGEVLTPSLTESGGRREAIHVEMTLEGPLEQMDLSLSSPEQPELDRLRLLSLLITGYLTPGDLLTTGDQNASTVEGALAFAGSQLTGPFAGFLEDQLERQLNFEIQLGAEVTTQRFRVTATKDIARRLTIEGAYEQTFESAALITTTARARLLLFDRAFFEAETELVTGGTNPDPNRSPLSSTLELKYRIFGK
ncbi:MAG: translocation/assembly module TamB domain-containing protein [Deltaproteobacteria bacterium]|nr:translocation/assembly module TamB domain-containing protein [Deltaproteobacteria bacterium]